MFSFTLPTWIKILIKITFWVGVVIVVFFTVIGNIGGKSPLFKDSVENVISQTIGVPVEIKEFNDIGFFPSINLDFNNMQIEHGQSGDAVGGLGRFHFRIGFWDVIWGTGRLREFELRQLYAPEGLMTRKELAIERITIEDNEKEGRASMIARGFYDGKPLGFDLVLKAAGRGKSRSYEFDPAQPVKWRWNDLEIIGALHKLEEKSGVRVEGFAVHQNEKAVLSGELNLKSLEPGLSVGGDLTTHSGSQIEAQGMLDSSGPRPHLILTLNLSKMTQADAKSIEDMSVSFFEFLEKSGLLMIFDLTLEVGGEGAPGARYPLLQKGGKMSIHRGITTFELRS